MQFYVLYSGSRIVLVELRNSLAMTAINSHDVPVRNTCGADIVSTRSADLWYLACCFTMKERGTQFPLSSLFNVPRSINFTFIEVLTETQNVVQSLHDCVKNGV